MAMPPTPDRTAPLSDADGQAVSDSGLGHCGQPDTSGGQKPIRDPDTASTRETGEPGPRIVTIPRGRLQPDDPPEAPPASPPRLPAAAELSPETLAVLLWELIHWLADEHVFLELTDHMSDAELYEFLRQEITDPDLFPDDGVTIASPLYGWGEEDCRNYVRYYCPEDKRADWSDLFTQEEMPPCEKPPYDRDRFLPVWRTEAAEAPIAEAPIAEAPIAEAPVAEAPADEKRA